MAIPLSHVFPTSASSSSSNHPKFAQSYTTSQLKPKPKPKPTTIKFKQPYPISITKDPSILIPKSTKETTNTNASDTQTAIQDDDDKSKDDGQLGTDDDEASASQSQLGAEIKKAMKERAEKEPGFLSGVAEEIGEIEWPAFGKVLGTTGVVLGVIAGSSVVLLTVNALLAELSDRVFVGKGVQDFFS